MVMAESECSDLEVWNYCDEVGGCWGGLDSKPGIDGQSDSDHDWKSATNWT